MVAGRLRTVSVLVLLAVMVVVGAVVAKAVARDQRGRSFHHYVQQYVDGWWSSADPGGAKRDKRWVGDHREQVMAEGERACAWLATRPDAPEIDPSGDSTVDALSRRFVKREYAGNPHLSTYGHSTITVGAWAYLCSGVRDDKTAPRSPGDD